PINTRPVMMNSVIRVPGLAIGMLRMRLKSVKPLLPPKPVSLRKNSSMPANVSACVMIEKYTPLMREVQAVAQRQDARVAPDEVHGERAHRVAHDLGDQCDAPVAEVQ